MEREGQEAADEIRALKRAAQLHAGPEEDPYIMRHPELPGKEVSCIHFHQIVSSTLKLNNVIPELHLFLDLY